VLDELTKRRIGVGVHYRAVHLHPFYAETYGLRPEQFPVATDISNRTISLPLGSNVTELDQDDVVAALTAVLRP
jgi:dTDP-4-amino-4,6-dideoxygalactose transaminase